MMRNPLRSHFFFFCAFCLVVLLFGGCSNDSDPDPDDNNKYYVRFKIDGVKTEYKAHTVAQFYYDTENLVYRCNIVSSLEPINTHDAMSLFLVEEEPYKTGTTYILQNEIEMAKNGAIMPQVTAVYIDGDAKAYTAQFLPSDWYDFKDEAEVKFTEITDEYVKGTFSARVFSAMPERQELLITDGEFFLSVYDD